MKTKNKKNKNEWGPLSVSEIMNTPPPWPLSGDIKIGKVAFVAKANEFEITAYPGGNKYTMDAERIGTSRGFLDYLFQIHDKPWMTGKMMKDFLTVVSYWTGRDHNKNPQVFYGVTGGMAGGKKPD